MKECLNCKKEYEAKRETSKFCSTSCRVIWYNKHSKGKKKITPMNMQELYNAVLSAVNSINAKNGQPSAAVFVGEIKRDNEAVMSYNDLRDLISAATSSAQLHAAWKQVERNKSLVSWQLRELGKLKDYQQTKIDF